MSENLIDYSALLTETSNEVPPEEVPDEDAPVVITITDGQPEHTTEGGTDHSSTIWVDHDDKPDYISPNNW